MAVAVLIELINLLGRAFATRQLDQWLTSIEQQREFRKALEETLEELASGGYAASGYGTLDISFTASDTVNQELWRKLLDPGVEDEISYHQLGKALETIYDGLRIGHTELDTIEFFVDTLMDKMWCQPKLQPLLTGKILRQHDHRLTLLKRKKLVREYLMRTTKHVSNMMKEDLGENRSYVEPYMEKQEKSDTSAKERKQVTEKYSPIDMSYFVEGSDSRIVVVADSGYGKTTLLRELFLRMSRAYDTHSLIPVYLSPIESAGCSETNIVRIISNRFRISPYRPTQIEHFVSEYLTRGRFLFLLDALDQVHDRSTLVGALASSSFGYNRVFVTTRPNVWEAEKGHLRNYTLVRLEKFKDTQWKQYIGNEKLEKLRETVDDEFLAVPILLKLISDCLSEKSEITPPIKNRAGIYRRIFTDLLSRQEDKDAVRASGRPLDDDWYIRHDLQKLAHDSLIDGFLGQLPRIRATEIIGDDKLKSIENRRGLVTVIESGDAVAFRHRSFQEYLAAEYLMNCLKEYEYDFSKMRSYLFHPDWEESIRFLAGLLEEDQAETLVDNILNPPEGSILILYREHLKLAAKCLHEMGSYGEDHRSRIFRQCVMESGDKVLGSHVSRILTEWDSSDVIRRLLDTVRTADNHLMRCGVQVLSEIEDPERVAALRFILGVTDSEDVICDVISVLARIKDTRLVPVLIDLLRNSVSEKVVVAVARALRETNTPEAVAALTDAAERMGSDDLRWRSIYLSAEQGDNRAIDILLRSLRAESCAIRRSAAAKLGEIRELRAVPHLLDILRSSSDRETLGATVKALGEIRDPEAVVPLINLLDASTDWFLSLDVRRALERFEDAASSGPLLELFSRTNNSYARDGAGGVLGKSSDPRIVPTLLDICHTTRDENVRLEAVSVLGCCKSSETSSALLSILSAAHHDDARKKAAKLLGQKKDTALVPPLLGILDTVEDESIKKEIVYALGERGHKDAIPALLGCLATTDSLILQGEAAISLGKIGDTRAVPALLNVLNTCDNEDIRRRATRTLGRFNDPVVTSALISLIEGDVKDPAYEQAATIICERKEPRDLAKKIELQRISALQERAYSHYPCFTPREELDVSPILYELAGMENPSNVSIFLDFLPHMSIGMLDWALLTTCSTEALEEMVRRYNQRWEEPKTRLRILNAISSCDRKIRRKDKVCPLR